MWVEGQGGAITWRAATWWLLWNMSQSGWRERGGRKAERGWKKGGKGTEEGEEGGEREGKRMRDSRQACNTQ